MQLGIFTYGDIVPDPHSGRRVSGRERMEQVLGMAEIAEQVGLDVFAVGEHHSPNLIAASPATILAGVAARTSSIRLSSAVTLLSTADPVRVFQDFATVDLISNGRAELIVGRGVFEEGFSLFGCDAKDHEALFVEKLELLQRLNASPHVTWRGRFRAPLAEATPAPRPVQSRLPVWIGAVSAAGIERAAALGLPLALPLLGGKLAHYERLVDHYRQAWVDAGHEVSAMRVAAFSHLNVADTASAAREDYYPYYTGFFSYLSDRGGISRAAYNEMSAPDGALMLGDPQEIVERLARLHERVKLSRYLGQIDIGGQSFAKVQRAIELFATKVAPQLRALG